MNSEVTVLHNTQIHTMPFISVEFVNVSMYHSFIIYVHLYNLYDICNQFGLDYFISAIHTQCEFLTYFHIIIHHCQSIENQDISHHTIYQWIYFNLDSENANVSVKTI